MIQITREQAEAARRKALLIERVQGGDPERKEADRRAQVKIWNLFCEQEQARIDAADAAKRGTPAAALLGGKSVHRF